jgi:TetR/AcrR family transcriptional repressor of nem operon
MVPLIYKRFAAAKINFIYRSVSSPTETSGIYFISTKRNYSSSFLLKVCGSQKINYTDWYYFPYLYHLMQQHDSKAERTRQYIIEKTAAVFNEKGFAGTSLSDLTKITGLTKGSIYGNFENKDEVALAVFEYNHARVTDYIKSQILSTDHAIERLLVYPRTYRNYLKIPFLRTGCPILNTATEADDTHPPLKEKAADALIFWKKAIENQVKRGISRKEIKPGTNPAEIAVVIISIIEGAFMQAKVTGRTTELNIAMNYLEEIIQSIKL